MHETENLAEADRLMTLCNSCRYCEGLCAVFPAMELRRDFPDGDLNYLANLCHACGACYVDCQFSPPHEFDVNVPKTLARVRADSFAAYAWPPAAGALFRFNGRVLAAITAASAIVFLFGFIAAAGPGFGAIRDRAGAFYEVMPHAAMATLFSAVFVLALIAIGMGTRRFWRDIGKAPAGESMTGSFLDAVRDAASLRYLDGGGAGCYQNEGPGKDRRRLFHHLTFYGFLLCFAATCVATVYHYSGWEAPYPFWSAPVLLGVIGGVGLVIGCAGLMAEKHRRDRAVMDRDSRAMDDSFVAMLLLVGVSGLLLLAFRDSRAMNALLALHLGFVFAFFVTMPYGKFVHAAYRTAALIRYAQERRAQARAPNEPAA